MYCEYCGKEIADDAYACPNCGKLTGAPAKPKTVYCRSCGGEMEIGAYVCPHCGVRTEGGNPPAYRQTNADSTGRTLSVLGFILAMVSIVFGMVCLIPAIVCCAIGMNMQKKSGEKYTLGKAGLIVGIVLAALYLLFFLIALILTVVNL